jgi:hypothetical protein
MAEEFRVAPGVQARLGQLSARVAERVAKAVAEDARRYAPVRTGLLVSRINAEGNRVWARTGYAVYVELGTRHAPAQPYLRPALYQRREVL